MALLDGMDALLHWIGSALGQNAADYCDLETADSQYTLVANDGSLVSIIKLHGATLLVGPDEFAHMHQGLTNALSTGMARIGQAVQVYFHYDKEGVKTELNDILAPAQATAARLNLDLHDLFEERINHLANYCASEAVFFVLWTRPNALSKPQMEQAQKNKTERFKTFSPPKISHGQNISAAIPELREMHDAFVRSILNDMLDINLYVNLMDVHTALYEVRKSVDPAVTSKDWRPCLAGDPLPQPRIAQAKNDISHLLWPSLGPQLIPRDGEVINLRTARIGDTLYSALYIDIFPQEIKAFYDLFKRVLPTQVPWRISFLIESNGIKTLGFKPTLASILSFASAQNILISDAAKALNNFSVSNDTPVVKLRVCAATWAPMDDPKLLKLRSAELTKALQGWGRCEIAEISGDSFAGALSSALALNTNNVANPSVAPLNDVAYMLPFTRPASPWLQGAALFRSPDGKPWPYQPGSTQQTTWIDLVYAKPGSGKSVLSNSINLALCLQGGMVSLPRISIIDIGPSSSGLISLIKEALPNDKKHLAAYHRLRMTPDYAINPFDTQLGCRYPSPQDRSFLVNFMSLLATPTGETKAYDGVADMAGLIIDELYKNLADDHNANKYTRTLNVDIDNALDKINYLADSHSTWWEITDVLFKAGNTHLASLAQRYCSPLMIDAVAISRSQVVEDLYGKITAPTGESLISAFDRMISSAVREYPLLSRVSAFDLGEARIVSLDLDEVAKTGGEAADRQTAVMYMLAHFILARDFYLSEALLEDFPKLYHDFHKERILKIREEPKRLVMDEFHRTSKAQAVRDQVIVDMREGRKWKIQVALLSQSLDDFDPIMVEFATSIFIMDAGPKQAIDKSVATFGLSETARLALSTRVHGPRPEGATFLAHFATKLGMNTQLCTATLGPIELWAFNTTSEDVQIRNALYTRIGAAHTRQLLAMLYPSGSAAPAIEQRLAVMKATGKEIKKEESNSIVQQLIEEIFAIYQGTQKEVVRASTF